MDRPSSRPFTILLALVCAGMVAAWSGGCGKDGGGAAPGNAKASPYGSGAAAGDKSADKAGSHTSSNTLVSSVRSEPRTFNRYMARDSTIETVTFLTQSRLVRVNRQTLELEPMLAEGWTLANDNRTYTLKLRRGLKFSDGKPFSSADVVFSFRAAYDEKAGTAVGESLHVNGKALEVAAVDADTVTIRFPSPFGPGLRILDSLPIYPEHLLKASLDAGQFAQAWGPKTPAAQIAGMGPFALKEYQPGHRMVFEKNKYYYRKDSVGRQLPYLDGVTIEIVPDQNSEVLRLQTGQIDCTQSEVRPEDYAQLKQAEAAGGVKVYDVGPGLDADSLWINLRREVKMPEAKRAWLQSVEFRRAVAEAVDRAKFGETVFLGAAVPVFGPVSPANRLWFDPGVPAPKFDPARASARVASLGLRERNKDGVLEDRSGASARFTLLTQKGNTALERGASVIRDSLQKIGIIADVVPMEAGALIERLERGDFEAIYFRFLTTDLDPAMNLDFWLSSGGAHVWNRDQKKPATEWERHVDELMAKQAASLDASERKKLFGEVQRVYADQVPILYFAAPRVYVATSSRVQNVAPSLLRPMVLWNADSLSLGKK